MSTTHGRTAAAPELCGAVRGPVFGPEDPRVVTELAGFNLIPDHRPAAVVGATGAADIAAAIRYAAGRGLAVGVLATGHGSLCHRGSVVITTRRLDTLVIDPVNCTATIGAGVRWREVIDAAARFGLAPPNGSSSDVGAVGYTLGGGLGPMARRFGYAADLVRSLDIVTADGMLRRISREREPDLFWAACGSKGAFGVVTAMEMELLSVQRFYGGLLCYDGEHAETLLHHYREWSHALPERTSTSIALVRLPPIDMVPEPLRGRLTVHLRFCHLGDAGEGTALLQPMLRAAPRVLQLVREMPYTAVDAVHQDPTEPVPFWETGAFLAELPASAVDTLLDIAGPQQDLPLSIVELRHLGGALARGSGNCVGGRNAAYLLGITAMAPAELREMVAAVGEGMLQAMSPYGTGEIPINFASEETELARPGVAWAPENRARLAALKRCFDPAGVFRTGYRVPTRLSG
jgi:FAD/FMN-containing dehydrogenase